MATSSITTNIVLSNAEAIESFANAVEASAKDKRIHTNANVNFINGPKELQAYLKKLGKLDE